MELPPSLERVIEELSKLPGIGRKTAQRLAFSLLQYEEDDAARLASSITQLKERIQHCPICFSLSEAGDCSFCHNPQRQAHVLCVVENPNNVFTIEKSHAFHGKYHVLMGAISPLDGIGPDQLKFDELKHRIASESIDELIIATNPTVSGEATALFLLQTFEKIVPHITRLAQGLPAGGDLEYVDDITLNQAFSGRQSFH